ncbi:MAG TPA: peptidoglycan-binding protein, partial [Thermoanaerobaculia bacterium]
MRWLLAAVVVAVTSAALRADPPVTIEAAVQTLQRGANLVIAGEPICAAHPLPAFYTRRNFAPAWSGADQVMLIDVIRHAADDGLDPADYHLAGIESLLPDAARRGELDLLLTDAFFLLSSHLQSGRTDPITIEPTWCLEPRTSDLVPALETALEIHEVPGAIAAFRPSHEGYRQLRDQLARYRGMTPWEPVAPGPSLRAGDSGPRVAQLIARLVASGDLEPGHPTFDAAVKAAVKHFQHLHGLEDDGVGGQLTIRELNVP